MSNTPSDKTKAIFQKNLIKELQNISGSTSLLFESIKKEDLTELTKSQKEYISFIHTFTNSLARKYIPDILESQSSSHSTALREANERIRELELKNGEDVDLSQASAFVNFTKDKIEKILKSNGLSVGVSVSVHACALCIQIKFYPLRSWSFSDDYNTTVEEIEASEKQKIKRKELFLSNFDIVTPRKETDINLASSDKNIEKILELMNEFDAQIKVDDIEVRESRKQTRYLSEMSFTLSTNNIFLGSRF